MPRLRGEQHPRRKLTANDVEAIRADYIPGEVRMVDLAQKYGVSTQNISVIIGGRTWGWLGEPGRPSTDAGATAGRINVALAALAVAARAEPDDEAAMPLDDDERDEQVAEAVALLAGVAAYDRDKAAWLAEQAEYQETDAQYLEAVLDRADKHLAAGDLRQS